MLSKTKRLKNLAQSAKRVFKHVVKTGQIRVPQPLYEYRIRKCVKCQYFDNWKCEKCGCFMKAKCRFEATKCPIGLW